MTGLTQHARDLSLPAQLGDPYLVLPTASELVEIVNERLLRAPSGSGDPPSARALTATVVHVRYKPAVAAAGTYTVQMDDGMEHAVSFKVHLGDKTEEGEIGGRYAEKLADACGSLTPFALIQELQASLWVFPADPKLPGAVRAFDMRRVARWIDRLGVAEPWTVRLRPSVLSLRRYKHSRRAVFHLLAKLRGEDGARDVREFGLRVLPTSEAGRSAKARAQLASLDLPIPKCVGHDPVAGWLLEEWLPGHVAERSDLSVAPHALGCAAQLHRAPADCGKNAGTSVRRVPIELLKNVEGVDAVPARLMQSMEIPASRWIHGDLHPDQVLLQDGGASLLDMDALRLGAVEEDLASWAADEFAFRESAEFDRHATLAQLAELYRSAGGVAVNAGLFRTLTAVELLGRAASSVRRLEAGALQNARRLVSLANSIASQEA